MYLLLLASPIGAKYRSSTCEIVRSASAPYRPVTQSAPGPQHPPGDKKRKRSGAPPLASDIFTRRKREIGRPVWLPECQHETRPSFSGSLPPPCPGGWTGWNQWRSLGAVTLRLWAEFALRVLSDARKDPSAPQPQPHLTPAAGLRTSVHPVVTSVSPVFGLGNADVRG